MKYRALLIDMGNVLAFFDLKRYTRNLSVLTKLPAQAVNVRLYGKSSWELTNDTDSSEALHRDILTGAVTPQAYFTEVQRRLRCNISERKFWEAYSDIFTVNNRLVDVLNRLRDRQRVERIIIVSDADPRRFEHALGLTGFKPDAVVVSYEVGRLKPHPDMYRRALELAHASAPECIFVDDMPKNVQGARDLGINGVQYLYSDVGPSTATDLLLRDFEALGLLG